jgi:hypothetical protein
VLCAHAWRSTASDPPPAPAACSRDGNSLDIFTQGAYYALWHRHWNDKAGRSAWGGSLGGFLTSSPAATSPDTGVIDVFARGGDNGLWQKSYHNGWHAWMSIGTMYVITSARSCSTRFPRSAYLTFNDWDLQTCLQSAVSRGGSAIKRTRESAYKVTSAIKQGL